MADSAESLPPKDTPPIGVAPFGYAGVRAATLGDRIPAESLEPDYKGKAEPVMLNGLPYKIFSGYLVPYYTPTEHERTRRNEELVMDRARRFFYTAEPELDIRLQRQQILEKMHDYETCPIAELHRIKGRYLVGAIINRMERLAKAILQKNIDGIGIEIAEGEDPHALSDKQVATFQTEFEEYYKFLIADSRHDPISYVRLRDLSTDRDGILLDLVREMGKPLRAEKDAQEQFVRLGIVQKIGQTMEAIDEARETLAPLLANRKVQRGISIACNQVVGPTYDERGERDQVTGFQRYIKMLDELTALSRARSGLKSEDSENFYPVRERITYLDGCLHEIHKALFDNASKTRTPELMEAQQILKEGVTLIRDMASTRIPRNHHAPEIYKQPENKGRDMSSCGRLASAVQRWKERDGEWRSIS